MPDRKNRQDGSPAHSEDKPSGQGQPDHPSPTAVQHVEPDKKHEPGGQHPDQTEALEQNVPGGGGQAQGTPGQPPGQHATGSFAGTGSSGKNSRDKG